MVILFPIAGSYRNLASMSRKGIAPNFCGGRLLPIQPPIYITGVSKDSTGAVLPSCMMNLFRVDTVNGNKVYVFVGRVISDGSGNYSFLVSLGNVYRVTGDNAAETVCGITLNSLQGV